MTTRSRYAVPADELDAVHVQRHEQVHEHAEPRPPQPVEWGGRLVPAFGGGGGGGGDTDGD